MKAIRVGVMAVAMVAMLVTPAAAARAHHAENCGTISRSGLAYGWCALVNTYGPIGSNQNEALYKYQPGPCDATQVYIDHVTLWKDLNSDGTFTVADRQNFGYWQDVNTCGLYPTDSVSTTPWYLNCSQAPQPNDYKAEAVFQIRWSDGVVGGVQDHFSGVFTNTDC